MCASWVGAYSHQIIVNRMNKSRNITGDGKVQYTASGFSGLFDIDTVLLSAVLLDNSLAETDKRRIVTAAKYARMGGKRNLTANDLIKAIGEEERKVLNRPPVRYVVLTSCSLPRLKTSVRYEGSTISIGSAIPKTFRQARESEADLIRAALHAELPKRYLNVRISARGRSAYEAMDTALDRFDEWRGIWNLGLNRSQGWRHSSGKRMPVNRIVVGPFHSLHKPNGQLAVSHSWYEPDYTGELRPAQLNAEKLKRLREYEVQFRVLLRRSKYKDWLRVAIRRYVRALDSTDWHASFLKLWSVLELLTLTGRRGYDETIRRASFVMPEVDYHRVVLEHLRQERNRMTHAGTEADDRETHLYQLKRYVDRLLELHLVKSRSLSTPQETAEFLDMPPALDELRRRSAILRAAYEYRGGK